MKLSDDNITRLAEMIDATQPKRMVVVSHFNPDGDAIGSTLAWRRLLKSMGHEVECVVPNRFPSFLSWIDDVDKIRIFKDDAERCSQIIAEADVLFFLDLNNVSRLEEMSASFEANTKAQKVLIDHHLQPMENFFDLMFSQPDSSSTCFLVYKIIERMKGVDVIDTAMASALYVGMMTDTGNFTFSFLTPDLYRAVAVLVEKGIDIARINVEVYNSHTEQRLRLLSYSLGPKMEVFEGGRAACISLSEAELRRFEFQQGDSEGFVNYPLSIKGVLISAMFQQTHRFIRASFRSRGDMDVNIFARRYFNGGGHKNAAGGKSFVSLKETVEYYKQSVSEYFKELNIE
ncbi:MAG: bifunctional oligoribonuclease/PAP phosphatase NrnA [Rikenellaceae bacterium]|nr:bifunctional oligoribonuclease/PAP phosphatase NrnA [Rikenellaceae bacterium]